MATIPINGDTVLEMWKTARFLKGSNWIFQDCIGRFWLGKDIEGIKKS